MPETMVVLGANSPIAQACLPSLLRRGYDLLLCARTLDKAQQVKAHLCAEGGWAPERITCRALSLSAESADGQAQALLNSVPDLCGLFTAVGVYAETCDQLSTAQAFDLTAINFTAQIPFLNRTAEILKLKHRQGQLQGRHKRGLIIAVSSVAAVRGRCTNYLYGASKAALSTYLDGMRQQYQDCAAVIELRPGLIATSMLDGRRLPALLIAQPQAVGRALERALRFGSPVVYAPRFWGLLAFFWRLIPHRLYGRLKF